ncbi:NACHT, LRR and PYD domains-containing protein 9 isoform X2 [Peromyscus maniculatus bairdii]|uniref:NACHT, LRR and PYD domains-containing protein 9 isoform X2 n=1 Tax=Peromyscus maniculatus bairdii TaxID=230844 RepID=UPI003FD672AB
MEGPSGFGVNHCLQKLSDVEFLKFKELLSKETEEFKIKPIPWNKIEMASRTKLMTLLFTHCPGQVWDIVSSLFLQINRADLSIMAQELRRDKQSSYKEIMKTIFQYIWNVETFICMKDEIYQATIEMQYKALQEVFDCPLEPVTAVVLGSEAQGKTTFLRKAMLDWTSGKLWQNRFQYVFFISLISLNNVTELSLAELMLAKLSQSSETLEDVLSDPKRILFILEGLEFLKFDLELRTNLCDDWGKMLPTQIVFSSLLQKVMLPESSLLLELGNPSVPKIYPLLRYPRDIIVTGFNDPFIKCYFTYFFKNTQKAVQVFNYLQSTNQLSVVRRSPFLCWMACSTLKWRLKRGEGMKSVGETDSSIYTNFMVSTFRSVYDNCPPNQNRARLKTLCTLAAEAMWKQVFVFTSEDLRRNGISESEKAVWLGMNFLQHRGDGFMFYHPLLQSYFAALFYFLRQERGTAHPIIRSLPQLLKEVYVHGQTQWLMTGAFVFGIATEKAAAMLKPLFGFIPSKEVEQEIFKCLRSLSQAECSEKLMNSQSLFESLHENEEERFETQVIDLFEEMTVDISNIDTLLSAAKILAKTQKLKKLHVHIQHNFFSEIYNPEDGDLEDFEFNKRCPFMTNFGDGALFHIFLQLPNLKSVNLYGSNLSNDMVENLCSVLKCTTCGVEELLLGKCDISSKACGMIATCLIYRKVKHLSLVENPLKNKGVMLLCEILKHPSCVLETLMLSRCCLNFIACGHLYEALLCNKYLSLLDLSSNVLKDTGVNILCEALKDPKCTLQELWLSGCFLTSDCCGGISAVLTSKKNLKTLKLGKNNIEDAGIKQLCEALRNPDCKLQCLGLDMNDFKTDCCEDLASALTTCKTLTSLNLDWITFDHDGLQLLCEALSHKSCNLKVLGLDKSALTEESKMLLQAVEMKEKLDILHCPWVKEERKRRGVRLVWNSTN